MTIDLNIQANVDAYSGTQENENVLHPSLGVDKSHQDPYLSAKEKLSNYLQQSNFYKLLVNSLFSEVTVYSHSRITPEFLHRKNTALLGQTTVFEGKLSYISDDNDNKDESFHLIFASDTKLFRLDDKTNFTLVPLTLIYCAVRTSNVLVTLISKELKTNSELDANELAYLTEYDIISSIERYALENLEDITITYNRATLPEWNDTRYKISIKKEMKALGRHLELYNSGEINLSKIVEYCSSVLLSVDAGVKIPQPLEGYTIRGSATKELLLDHLIRLAPFTLGFKQNNSNDKTSDRWASVLRDCVVCYLEDTKVFVGFVEMMSHLAMVENYKSNDEHALRKTVGLLQG